MCWMFESWDFLRQQIASSLESIYLTNKVIKAPGKEVKNEKISCIFHHQ